MQPGQTAGLLQASSGKEGVGILFLPFFSVVPEEEAELRFATAK